jgi:hypothetical protein
VLPDCRLLRHGKADTQSFAPFSHLQKISGTAKKQACSRGFRKGCRFARLIFPGASIRRQNHYLLG